MAQSPTGTTVMDTTKPKIKWIWLIIAAAVFAISFFIPAPAGMEPAGKQALMLLVISLILLLTNCIEIGIAGFLLFALQPIMGAATFGEAMGVWSMTSSWFLFASFGLSGVISSTSVPKKVLGFMLNVFGHKTRNLLMGIMVGTAIISMFVSNVPACAIPAAFVMVLIDAVDDPVKKKKLAMPFMLGIPIASMIGGMGTPAGSTANVIALDMLEQYSGLSVSWLQWIAIGLPLVIVMTPIACFMACLIFPPPEIDEKICKDFVESQKTEPMDQRDKTFVLIMVTTVILWILSSWFSALTTSMVAILALCAFAITGVTSMEDILKRVPWNALVLGLGFGSVADCLNKKGVVTWIIDNYVSLPSNINLVFLLIVVGVIIALLHIPVPTGPSLIRILAGPMIAIGLTINVHPAFMIMALCFHCSANFLLPLDSVPIVTYGRGFYSFGDYAKAGAPFNIVYIILVALWLPIILKLLGLLVIG